jgi:ATP-dependent DNA ligase
MERLDKNLKQDVEDVDVDVDVEEDNSDIEEEVEEVEDDEEEELNEISYNEDPKTERWSLFPIYIQTATEGIRYWRVSFNGKELVIKHGFVEGKAHLQISKSEIEPKGGKSIQEQAIQEARERYRKKYRSGYRLSYQTSINEKFLQPMLGHPFCDKNGKERKISFPCYGSPKLDGIRGLCRVTSFGVEIRSRNNIPFKHFSSIKSELDELFLYLPQGCQLDGELYRHGFPFNTLSSIIRTEIKVHPQEKEIEYHLFDIIIEGELYYDRISILIEALEKLEKDKGEGLSYIRLVPIEMVESREDVTTLHDKYIEEGYEGLILRQNKPYAHSRSVNILKVKMFEEEEAEIVSVKEGTGQDKGTAIFVVNDSQGLSFSVRMASTIEQRKEWYKNKDSLIGKRLTYRYQSLSEKGIPRFPTGKAIRDYE